MSKIDSFAMLKAMRDQAKEFVDDMGSNFEGGKDYPINLNDGIEIWVRPVLDENGDWYGSARTWDKKFSPEVTKKAVIMKFQLVKVVNEPREYLAKKEGEILFARVGSTQASVLKQFTDDIFSRAEETREEKGEDADILNPFSTEDGFAIVLKKEKIGDRKGVLSLTYDFKVKKATQGELSDELLETETRTIEEFCKTLTEMSLKSQRSFLDVQEAGGDEDTDDGAESKNAKVNDLANRVQEALEKKTKKS